MNIKSINLQPLRIPAGWCIIQNKFIDVEPSDITGGNNKIWFYFTDDILQISHSKRNIIIDLGWYPDIEPDGNYILVAVANGNWENPIDKFESRSKEEITTKIEYLIKKFSENIYDYIDPK